MLKFNLAGSVQDELEKIAIEKGWYEKYSNYTQIKKDQLIALQKLLNKATSGNENSPLKVDGIWGFNTAGIYEQVRKRIPSLEMLYGNSEPTNKQVLNAIKILFYSQHEDHGKEILDSVKQLKIPEAKMPAGFIPEKEYKGPGKEIVDSTREAVKGLMSEEKKPAVTNKSPFDAKKLEEERVKYYMESRELTEKQARDLVKLENEARQRKVQTATDYPWEQNPSTKAQKLNFPYEKNVAPWVDPLTEADQSVEPKTQDQTQFVRKPETKSNVAPAKVNVQKPKPAFKPSEAVKKFQEFARSYFPDLKNDSFWGPKTNQAWQALVPSGLALYGGPNKKPQDELIYRSFEYIKKPNNNSQSGMPKSQTGAPLAPQAADDPGAKNEEAMNLASQGVPVEEALKNVASNTISCLVSLADELDSAGETKVAIAIDNQINFYKKAMDKLYDVMGETGEDFINSAHTDHVTIAPSKEEGGKIENVVEQQKKDLEIATKDPIGKYAATILELVATANKFEEEGLTDAAERVDMAIAELQKKFPFANEKLASEAASFFGKKYASETEEFLPSWYKLTSVIYARIYSTIMILKNILGRFDSAKPYEKAKFEKIYNTFNEFYKFYNNLWSSGKNEKGYISFPNMNGILEKDKEFLNKISSLSDAELKNTFGFMDKSQATSLVDRVKKTDEFINNFIVKFKPYFEKFNSMSPEEQKQYLYGYKEKLPETKKDDSVTKNTEVKKGPVDESKLTETQKIYLKQIKNFIYNLENTKKLLVQNAEAIGSALGKGPEFSGKLADALVGEAEKMKASLNDPSKYEEMYNYVKSFGASMYNLSQGLSAKFSKANKTYENYLKIKTAELDKDTIDALKQLGDAFAPKPQGKAKPGTPTGAISKRQVPGAGYNRNIPSDEVEKLQKYLGVKIDGKYGPITHKALMDRLPQIGGNISIPANFNDVRVGNIEQIGDVVRQSGSPESKPSTLVNVTPKSNEKIMMEKQWREDGATVPDGKNKSSNQPLSNRVKNPADGDIVDPWAVEGGGEGGVVGEGDVEGGGEVDAKVYREQLKKGIVSMMTKYKYLNYDYENGLLDSLSKFESQYDDYEQELSKKLSDVRKIHVFLKKYGESLGNYDIDFDNLRQISEKLMYLKDEFKNRPNR